VVYREYGANHAAQYGGVAALIRSITDFSMYTVHTGGLTYFDNTTKIPAASLTVEDAMLLDRLQEAGNTITINLKLLDYDLPPATSRNAFGEITGSELPHEIVAVSGHIDSWEVGQGAIDDAGGIQISVEALYLLKSLNLRPRRTLQAILWTSEEFGYIGALAYAKAHANELHNFTAAFESDHGAFNAVGLEFAGTDEAGCIVYEILKLLEPYGMNQYVKYKEVGSDIEVLEEEGVPGVALMHDNDLYSWYHHTEADVLTVLDSDELDRCTAIWAAASYVVADLTNSLPKKMSH
jgi:carboxypeptidase Q